MERSCVEMTTVQLKLNEIKKALSKKFFEREEVIEGLMLGLLAQQNTLLIGEAGTAKSALISSISNAVEGAEYFQWLVGQTTTPEELYGALSLKDLEQGVYKRNTANKLPTAHIAFLDEIFKTNSAILNSMLTIINERIFYNNGGIVHSPLMALVGASNEYPQEEGLEALFDRFMLRYEIGYMNEKDSFVSMLEGVDVQVPTIQITELIMAQAFVKAVTIPKSVLEALFELRMDLKTEGVIPSDRRFKQSLSLLQARAFLDGRTEVKQSDFEILGHALWVEPEQILKTREIVAQHASDIVEFRLKQFKMDLEYIQKEVSERKGEGLAVLGNLIAEANQKIQKLMVEVDEMRTEQPNRQEITDFYDLLNQTKVDNGQLLVNF